MQKNLVVRATFRNVFHVEDEGLDPSDHYFSLRSSSGLLVCATDSQLAGIFGFRLFPVTHQDPAENLW
jgi:hypothetical protein